MAIVTITTQIDFPGLKLPDGTRADALRRLRLYAELVRLGVGGISAEKGKIELLQAYETHLANLKALAVTAYNPGDEIIRALQANQVRT
jgi:hypothetical protein